MLANASTGYVYHFEIYSGKSVERQMPLGEHVVWSLTSELSMKFHHVYFKNGQSIQLDCPIMIQDCNFGKVEVDWTD